jgi:hypothetical protein
MDILSYLVTDLDENEPTTWRTIGMSTFEGIDIRGD